MPKEDRFKPNLVHLSPKSVIKVFKMIEDLINIDTLPTVEEQVLEIYKSDQYQLDEKYFILSYFEDYFDLNKKRSFINQELIEREDLGDSEEIEVWKSNSLAFIKQALSTVKILKKTLLVGYKANFKSKKQLGFSTPEIEQTIKSWEKMPLITTKKKLFREINRLLQPHFNKNEIDGFISNSFQIGINEPPKLLNLHLDRQKDFYIIGRELYEFHKTLVAKFITEVNKGENAKLRAKIKDHLDSKNQNYIREQFKQIPEKTMLAKLTKKDFAKLLFLSSPKIRYNYSRLSSKRNVSIDEFIDQIAKNLRGTKT